MPIIKKKLQLHKYKIAIDKKLNIMGKNIKQVS